MRTDNNKIVTGCLCALGCEVLFGLSYVFTKQATGTAGAFELPGWRFLTAFIVMSICVLTGIIKVNLKEKNLKPLLLVALFSPILYFIGETVGIDNTSASESGNNLSDACCRSRDHCRRNIYCKLKKDYAVTNSSPDMKNSG